MEENSEENVTGTGVQNNLLASTNKKIDATRPTESQEMTHTISNQYLGLDWNSNTKEVYLFNGLSKDRTLLSNKDRFNINSFTYNCSRFQTYYNLVISSFLEHICMSSLG